MVNSCRRSACFPDSVWPVLLYCGWGKGGQVTGRTGAERQAGCRRGKRIEKGLHRISPRIVRTVIFGTSGNVDVQKIAAITFSRK